MDLQTFLNEWHNDSPYIRVHTSGSTGKPKVMLAEKKRMEASARITCQFLGLTAGDSALLCLPLDYIAGKMMVVRALTCGLRLVSVEPSGHPLAQPFEGAFAAMVPMQVWNSLQDPEECERLMLIRHLIIGGGAIDPSLERALKDFPNAVWSTYGMTETLSHIALRRLNGPEASEWYTPFKGVTLSQDADGCLVIDAPEVCPHPLHTNDIAELLLPSSERKEEGLETRFRILGRKDNVICSGGIKIQTEEAERLLRPHLTVPFCITKRSDPRLGEAVVLLTEATDIQQVRSICEQTLPKLWRPRHYVSIARIPLTGTGKIARHEAFLLAQ